MQRPLIVIPTYNELDNIKALIPVLLDLPVMADLLVVDDSSPDGTGEAVLGFRDTGRVHLLFGRGEDQVYIVRGEPLLIFFQNSRVFLEIFTFTELGGIDKNGNHLEIALRSGHLDQ